MVVTGFISVVLTAIGIQFSPWPDFSDQGKGFETRHTDLSKRVVTWTRLDKQLSIYPDISQTYFRQLQPTPTSEKMAARRKRQAPHIGATEHHPTPSGKTFLESFFAGAADSSPCFQLTFDDDGSFAQNAYYFSQVIFESRTFEKLFSLSTMQALCKFQTDADKLLDPIRSSIDYPHFWSFPNYITCMNGLLNCNEITEKIMRDSAKLVQHCVDYRDSIINCGLPQDSLPNWKRGENCTKIPESCRSKYIFGLFYFILSSNIGNQDDHVYTNMIMPALTYEAYQYQGVTNVTSDSMLEIFYRVKDLAENVRPVDSVGINMGIKFIAFLESFYQDCFYVLAAWILVYFVIWVYSGSLFFTAAVLFSVVLSMGISYFVYRLVFRLKFFPFMNLLMVILLIGIGADDTFVLMHIFDTSSRKARAVAVNGVTTTIPISFGKEDMRDALSHAALSMFVCSATTAAAFYANLVSDIVVIKCFGVFAGTTMLANYLLVVTWLPASLIVLHKYLDPLYERVFPQKCVQAIRKARTTGAILPNYFLLTALPKAVMTMKYLWIGIFGGLFIGSCVVVFYQPGVALPQRNPLQMFKPSNPLEWYDDYATEYFSFASDLFSQPMEVVIVFGIRPVDDNAIMDPNDPGGPMVKMYSDPDFKLNLTFLHAANDVCRKLNKADFMNSTSKCFPEYFFQWSAKQDCSKRKNVTGQPCCNIKQGTFREDRDLVFCLAEASKTVDVMTGGPIFRISDLKDADGFVLYYGANYTWSPDHGRLEKFFGDVDGGMKEILHSSNLSSIQHGWFVTTVVQAIQWYDLQISLLRGTSVGILISVGVALIVAAITMRAFVLSVLSIITVFAINVVIIACLILLGWRLNIVESTLIVLTVGLAFDFTLNYAVAYQLSPKGTREQKVCTVLQYMGMPVFLAFLTTFLAGLVMLPSSIMAYYQIGVFMVLVGGVSWLYSALFFLSLLAVIGPEDCEWTLLKNTMPRLANRCRRGLGSSTADSNESPAGNRSDDVELQTRIPQVQQNGRVESESPIEHTKNGC